jgi:hypothetical protein
MEISLKEEILRFGKIESILLMNFDLGELRSFKIKAEFELKNIAHMGDRYLEVRSACGGLQERLPGSGHRHRVC